jgi:hypothetical protein
MRAQSIIILREMFPRWSGIVGAIRNSGQGNSTVLARFANLDSSARWSFLTTRAQRLTDKSDMSAVVYSGLLLYGRGRHAQARAAAAVSRAEQNGARWRRKMGPLGVGGLSP